jgi:hypothetical protein
MSNGMIAAKTTARTKSFLMIKPPGYVVNP